MRLSFGLQNQNQLALRPFSEVQDILWPLLYLVVNTKDGKKTIRDIPLDACTSDDDSYSDLASKSSLLCPKMQELKDDKLALGILAGEPGQPESSYLVFTVMTVPGANLSRDFLEQNRVVAFASHYHLNDE